ncbi:hypothetical protein PAPHI01_0928 [Pancytospora philotis]|nr:hypothetical protein PAPHI01_0928 [Pancytospora philotis]
MTKSPAAFLCSCKAVRVLCRNGKARTGKLRMYDKHCSIVLELDGGRELYIRGDSIISISKC